MHTRNRLNALLAALMLTLAAPVVLAVDYATTAAATDSLATARNLIAEKKWLDAVGELKRVNEARSADWNNLMGYACARGKRQTSTPQSGITRRRCGSIPSTAARLSILASST